MNFAPDSQECRYRDLVRELAQTCDWAAMNAQRAEIKNLQAERYSITFNRKISEAGLLGVTWPEPYGRGATQVEYYLLREEIELQGLPAYGFTQLQSPGAMLIRSGSPDLLAEHLPRIKDGTWRYCAGLSEPEAGSDLLALRTKAVRDGDYYVVNGSKLWTSGAHLAHWCSTLVRTDAMQTRARGLSMLMIELKSPGVEIRPVYVMGGWHVNALTFTNVRVPARNLVGKENEGWSVLTGNLDEERSMSFGGTETRLLLARLIHRYADRAGELDEADLEALGSYAMDAEVDRLLNMKVALAISRGEDSTVAGPISKAHGAEMAQRFVQWAADLVGQDALYEGGRGDVLASDLEQQLRVATVLSIIGGTSEIQRNTIAGRLLHLPKGS